MQPGGKFTTWLRQGWNVPSNEANKAKPMPMVEIALL